MPTIFFRSTRLWILLLGVLIGLSSIGCEHMPIDVARGPAPLRHPRPEPDAETYEDSLTGGQVFAMYCTECHNARALAERPFANLSERCRERMHVRGQPHGRRVREAVGLLRSEFKMFRSRGLLRSNRRPSTLSSRNPSPNFATRSRHRLIRRPPRNRNPPRRRVLLRRSRHRPSVPRLFLPCRRWNPRGPERS